MAAISDNQNKYLTNMAAGKTSTGGVASAGQQTWAKAQLAKVPAPTQTKQPTLPAPQPSKVPAPPTSPSGVQSGAMAGSSSPQAYGVPKPGISVPAPPQQPAPTFSGSQYNDWLAKQNETFANLEKLVNTPFNYNPETDPGYLAQRQLSQQRAGVATQNALESANERGIMGSSMNISQLGQIQQSAEQEALAYIPEYRQQAFGQYQNQLANAGNLLGQARALRGDQFGESVTEAGLTGNYNGERTLDGKQTDLANKQSNWNAYMDMVNQTGNLGTGPKNTWQNLVTSAYGGDQTNSANQQDFNQGITMAQLTGTLPDGTPTSDEQQRQLSNLWTAAQQTGTIPNEIADLYGIKRGTRTQDAIAQAEQIAISQMNANTSRQNANTSAYSANTSRMNADTSRLMDIWQATGVAPEGIPGVAAGTQYGSELDRSYRQAQVDQMGAKSDPTVSKPTKNDLEAEYYTNLDKMMNHGMDLKSFFNKEKENIIRDLGKSGFDALKQSYGIYN